MMDNVVSRETIRQKARSAYKRRVPRDGHNFNWHSVDAISTWQDEWDRGAAAEAAVLKVKPMLARAEASPP